MKDVKEYLKEANIPTVGLEEVLKRIQEDAFQEGYRAAGDQMLAIADSRMANVTRMADFARKAS